MRASFRCSRRARGVCAVAVLSWLLGCGGAPDVILRTADGVEVTAEDIDRQPLWLLPPGGVGWFHLDVTKATAAEFGRFLLADLAARIQLPESAGVSLERDVASLSVASYSMKGVDFAGVAIGRFDEARITAAATEYKGGPVALGLTRSDYAGRTLFSSLGVGFSVVTARTLIFGNEVGIRRCLDRIAEGRVADDLPSWAKELLANSNAAFSLGIDLNAASMTAALPSQVAALQGASVARGLGNFEPPGINLAATITYADHGGARGSADNLLRLGGNANLFARLLGLGEPIRKLETRAVGNDTQVVLALDRAAIELLMSRFLPPPPAPPPAAGPGWARRAAPPQYSAWLEASP